MKPKKLTLILAILCLFSFQINAQEFVNELMIPPKITYSNSGSIDLDVIQTTHNFNPNGTDSLNTMVTSFAFEDFNNPGTTTILGPTINWIYKEQITTTVLNTLDENTTCHWHGAHVPQAADGGPHQIIGTPNSGNDLWEPPTFEVKDKPATMWYHPHAMGLTYKQVQMGLSGMIYVQDLNDIDPVLSFIEDFTPQEYGVDDIPLIFQTKKFKRGANNEIEIQAEDGYKDGYTYMVNGLVDPVLNVPANMIRLRFLNGDGKFSFNLSFFGENNVPENFQLMATDAGYTDRTYELRNILMAPGERTEWLVDLRGREGDVLYIENIVSGIPDGVIGNSTTTNGYATDRKLLKIVVGPSTQPASPIIAFPINLAPSDAPGMDLVTKTRVKTFRKDPFMIDGEMKQLYNIDSTLMDMTVVNDVVRLDSTEIWTIDNTTDIAHPWHIHDIHFWVTEVIDKNNNNTPLNPNSYPQIFGGPKDNVLVMPGWKLSYIATFSDYGTEIKPDSSYMYHCHILPHEDRGMMGQFVVWNLEGDPQVSTEDPALSDRPMKLFPNPASNLVYLEGNSSAESNLRIFDLQGRLLEWKVLPAFDGAIRLNTNHLPKGMLLLEWMTEEGKAVSKLLVE